MENKLKLSQLPEETTISDLDLIEISKENSGSYLSKKITYENFVSPVYDKVSVEIDNSIEENNAIPLQFDRGTFEAGESAILAYGQPFFDGANFRVGNEEETAGGVLIGYPSDSLTINIEGVSGVPWDPVSLVCPKNIIFNAEIGGKLTSVKCVGKWIQSGKFFKDSYSNPGITSISLPDLVGIYESFLISPSLSALTNISSSSLVYCGSILFSSVTAPLTDISFSSLKYCESSLFEQGALDKMTAIEFPSLEYCGYALFSSTSIKKASSMTFNKLIKCNNLIRASSLNSLLSINVAELTTSKEALFYNVSSALILDSINIPKLNNCGDYVFQSCTMNALRTMSFPLLTSVTYQLFSGVTMNSLTAINIPSLKYCPEGMSSAPTGAKLSQNSVNHLLTIFSSMDGSNGTSLLATGTTVSLAPTQTAAAKAARSGNVITVDMNCHPYTVESEAFIRTEITSVTGTGTGTVMTFTKTNHGSSTGDIVIVTGASIIGYNGKWTVLDGSQANTFTVSGTASGSMTGAVVQIIPRASRTVTPITETFEGCTVARAASATATITFPRPHLLRTGSYITISNSSTQEYNGSYILASATPGQSTATITMPNSSTDSVSGITVVDSRNRFSFPHVGKSETLAASLYVDTAPPSYSGSPMTVTSITGATTQLNIVGSGFVAANLVAGEAVTIYGMAMGAAQINGTYKILSSPAPTDTTFSVSKASCGTAAYVPYSGENRRLITTSSCNINDSLKYVHTLVSRGVTVNYNLIT